VARYNEVGTVATKVYRDGGDQVVKYHYTEVVRWDNERIVLDSGGWMTATTKTRMNQAANQYGLGYTVFQRDYEWFVDYNGDTLEFSDGMILERIK
jgi:hypothetical protein